MARAPARATAGRGMMSKLNALPIACTLRPGDLRERLDEIQALTREALLGYERNGLQLALRYRPDAIERVRAMIAGELHCCAFLNFDVRAESEAICVTITAPENARDAADELFAHFIGRPLVADADR
jgi:hypothetical protein